MSMDREFVCRTCNLLTFISNQNEAKSFHRRMTSSHEPDLITYGEWSRLREKSERDWDKGRRGKKK